MRLVKMTGLAVMAALASMAFIGAGTASADSVCHVEVAHNATCPSPLASGTLIRGLTTAGNPAVLLNASKEATMTCHSTALGKVGTNLGSHKGLTGLIDELAFTNCSGLCATATGINEPYLMLANALSLHVVVEKHASGGTPGALMTGCFGFVNCQYSLTNGNALLDVSKDLLIASNEPLTRSGHSALCPATGFWDANYLLTLDVSPFDDAVFLAALP